jgi:pimeloyl-ACP methyl ester carboxylesterase
MATYVLIHGAGDGGWYWHLVAAALRERGHDVVAPDLPSDDDSARLSDYADSVLDAIGDRTGLVVVAQSFGGFTAPLVCDRVETELLVLVAGMIRRATRSRPSTTTSHRSSRPRRWSGCGLTRPPHRCGSRGHSGRGPTSPRGSCSAATIASSRPLSSAASQTSAWLSHRTRSTAGTASPSAARWSLRIVSRRTPVRERRMSTTRAMAFSPGDPHQTVRR